MLLFLCATASIEIFHLSLHDALPICEISMKDVFRSGDSSKKFKIAEGQWYRYAPSYVSPAYHLLEGFPFIQEGDKQEKHRSEERFSRNAETDLVCRLLLEKKKKKKRNENNQPAHHVKQRHSLCLHIT